MDRNATAALVPRANRRMVLWVFMVSVQPVDISFGTTAFLVNRSYRGGSCKELKISCQRRTLITRKENFLRVIGVGGGSAAVASAFRRQSLAGKDAGAPRGKNVWPGPLFLARLSR